LPLPHRTLLQDGENLVRELQKARKNGMLLTKAKELLEDKDENAIPQGGDSGPPRLRRVCWCWVQPAGGP